MHPILFASESFLIPTYVLTISITCSLAIIWATKRAEAFGFDRNTTLDLGIVIMISGFLGARLTHVLWEVPSYYIENPLDVLKVWQGGFVFFGGALFAFLAALIFIRKKQLSFWKWADFAAPVIAFTYGVGRLGCFLAGCCYGRPTHMPWAVIFPAGSEAPAHIARHPTQLYAMFWELGIVVLLLALERVRRKEKSQSPLLRIDGFLFLLWVILHGFGRIIMEVLRGDFRGPSVLGLSISTIISLALIITATNTLRFRLMQSKKESNE